MNNQNDTADSVSAKLSAREEFALRCLNAAVNLYGALTYDEFVNLYNRYAADKLPEIAAEMTATELPDLIERLQRAAEIDYESDDDRDVADDKPNVWFSMWVIEDETEQFVVNDDLTCTDDCEDSFDDKKIDEIIDKRINHVRERRLSIPLKILDEKEFLEYEEPTYNQDSPEIDKFIDYVSDDFKLARKSVEFDVMEIRSHIRSHGATVTNALEGVSETCLCCPQDWDEFEELIREISSIVGVTRTWYYRGHTAQELAKLNLLPHLEQEKIPDVFGIDSRDDDMDSVDIDEANIADAIQKMKTDVASGFNMIAETLEQNLAKARELVFSTGDGASRKIAEGADIVRKLAEDRDLLGAWQLMLEAHEKRIGPFKTNKFRRQAKAAIERLSVYSDWLKEFDGPAAPDRIWPDFSRLLDCGKDDKVLKDYDRLRRVAGEYSDSKCARLADAKDLRLVSEVLDVEGNGVDSDFVSAKVEIIVFDFCEFLMRAANRPPAVFEYIRKKERGGDVDDSERELFACWKGFRFVIMKLLKQFPGFGVHCRDLLSGKELFVVDRGMSNLPGGEKLCMATGVFPFGEAFMTTGTGLPLLADGIEHILDMMLTFVQASRPVELDRHRRAQFAAFVYRTVLSAGVHKKVKYL